MKTWRVAAHHGIRPRWDWGWVHRVALRETRRVLGAGSEAEDAAQEAALRAWRRQGSCRSSDAPGAWIRQIAYHEALRTASARPPEAEHPDDPEWIARTAVHDPRSASDDLDLRGRLEHLPADDRRLLFLRYWEDLSHAEIARRVGAPEGTVKVRLHRARGMLRRSFEEEEP